MKNGDSAKNYGLIGAVLIITAFVLWAFVLPALSTEPEKKNIDTIVDTPVQRQETPTVPVTDSPIPRP